ncbi:TusA-related sulfurtransferase [Cytobacillus purgationiresistens]|uniref:TusA-related sulfurtransferase n=1 Tax=Cytobacillus purgationiresistens TaxID=863449 RepID=A0ABU0AGQ5_9BACI|nr:TusA-related sulfurtransferase [Cytobacillus purgationiresistens]
MNDLEQRQVLEVHSTDKGSINDISAWTKSCGHTLLKQEEEDGVYKFWIQKK